MTFMDVQTRVDRLMRNELAKKAKDSKSQAMIVAHAKTHYWAPHCGDKNCDGGCGNLACIPPAKDDLVVPNFDVEHYDYSKGGREQGSKGIRAGKPEHATALTYIGYALIGGDVKGQVAFDSKEIPPQFVDELLEWLIVEMVIVREKGMKKIKDLENKPLPIVYAPRPKRNRFVAAWLALWGKE